MVKKSAMVRLRSILHVFIILLYIHLNLTCCRSCFRSPGNNAAFFIFGDSYLDSGNNNYINTTTLDQANFWPYGETYFNFPTGRFSNGRLASDFIAQYVNLPVIPPFLQQGIQYHDGVNFASAGAGALVETFQGSVIDLETQLNYFKEVETWFKHNLGDIEAKMKLSNAVYLFSIGSNDYMSPFLTDSSILRSYSDAEYVQIVIGNLTSVLKEIYRSGGRNFGFINVPVLGCLPGFRIFKPENNGSCFKQASLLAKLHNEALIDLLKDLETRLPCFKYSLFDFNSFLDRRINHHSKYGYKEGKTACCGTGEYRGIFSCGGKRIVKEYELCENPSEYVFWDSFHLTEKVYEELADEMWRGVVPSYNLKNLFLQ